VATFSLGTSQQHWQLEMKALEAENMTAAQRCQSRRSGILKD
jgi:hypothetical protein